MKREHDATTAWMREFWTGPNASAGADVGTTVFNCALFRYYGTIELAERIAWVTDATTATGGAGGWDPEAVVAACVGLRAAGFHCFSRGYCRPHRNGEHGGGAGTLALYRKVAHV